MASLHISKVAVGCASFQALDRRHQARVVDGVASIRTRFRPRQAEALIGGSIYWIVKHRIIARQTILGFDDDGSEKRTLIRLHADLVTVHPHPKRAHQGWRYLSAEDAPPDLNGDGDGSEWLPAALANKLAALALI